MAAALTHRVNSLGNQLEMIQAQLSSFRQRHASSGVYAKEVKRCEEMEQQLLDELEAANQVAQQFFAGA